MTIIVYLNEVKMRRLLMGCLIGSLVFGNAYADISSEAISATTEILNKSYDSYNSRFNCWLTTSGQFDQTYCMKPVSMKRAKTEDGEIIFLLATGGAINPDTGEDDPMHASGGLVGMFNYKVTSSGYKMIAMLSHEEMGSWSTPPSIEDGSAKFLQIGPTRWGWLFETGYTNQGYTDVGATIYSVEDHAIKPILTIATGHSDEGAFGKTDIVGEISVDAAGNSGYSSQSEYFPINVTVSGKLNGRKVQKKKYTFRYDENKRKYIPPKGYPI